MKLAARMALGTAVSFGLLMTGTPARAYLSSLTVNKCLQAKIKAAGKAASAYAGCHAKNTASPDASTFAACKSGVDGKTTATFGKVDTKYPGACPGGNGDGASRSADAGQFANDANTVAGGATGKCDAAKQKCLGKYFAAITGCYGKAAGKTGAVDNAPGGCTAKAAAKLADGLKGCLDKAAAAGDCSHAGSQAAEMQGVADTFISRVSCALDPTNPGCSCPTSFAFTANGTDADLDLGWTGLAHDEPLTTNDRLTLAVSGCANAMSPCGTCSLSGPIPNAGGVAFANRRCRGDSVGANGSWITCSSDLDCPGVGNGCTFFFGPPDGYGVGGVPWCQTNELAGAVTGTVDPTSGSASMNVSLTLRLYSGITVQHPCPQCVAGSCDFGQRAGMACVVNGINAVGDDASLDCPPSAGGAAGTVTLPLQLTTGTQTRTLSAASPNCRAPGFGSLKCLCDTCNDLAATPCASNADCGTGICGGRRCIGGTNAGAPCTAGSECPSGSCSVPGDQTAPNACLDGVCSPNPSDTDSVDEGTCAAGPFERYCAIETNRGCNNDSDCIMAGDSCSVTLVPRECYTADGTIGDDVSVAGAADPVLPSFGAMACLPPTGTSFINNSYGLPGLGRFTIPGISTFN